MTTRTDPQYFAIPTPDPGNHTPVSYWRRNDYGVIRPWPPRARYGPILWKKPGDGHVHVVPAGLHPDDRRTWVNTWYATVRAHWLETIGDAIDAEPVRHARLFAELCVRCCFCGRALTEDYSKVVGIGPECRRGVPAAVLAEWLTPKVAEVHASALGITEGTTP